MPLAFLGAIWGFFRGLFLGLAALAAGVLALALISGESRGPVATQGPAAPPAIVTAAAPATLAIRAASAPATPAMALGDSLTDSGAQALAPASATTAPMMPDRINADALAAMNRADAAGLAGGLASAPRPMAAGDATQGSFAAGAPVDVSSPIGARPAMDQTMARPTPARLAALVGEDGARGTAPAEQALVAVAGLDVAMLPDGGGALAGLPSEAGAALQAPDIFSAQPRDTSSAQPRDTFPAQPREAFDGQPRMAAPLAATGDGRIAALGPMGMPMVDDSAPMFAAPGMAPPGASATHARAGQIDAAPPRVSGDAPLTGGTDASRAMPSLGAPMGRMPAAPSPAPAQRVASLTPPAGATVSDLPAPGAMTGALAGVAARPSPAVSGPAGPDAPAAPAGENFGPAATPATDAAAARAAAPEAGAPPRSAADMSALRALIARQTGGVPLPFARPSGITRPQATPVERLDLAAPARDAQGVPVRRQNDAAAQLALGLRDAARSPTATPVMRLDVPRTPPKRNDAGPNATAPVVMGPGRLDDRRASSLVAAISTRPGAGVSAPRIVGAPGLSLTPGGRSDSTRPGTATFGAGQTSAPRPSFGAAPSLGGAGGGMIDDAPLGLASRGAGAPIIVASRTAGAASELSAPTAPERSPFFSPSTDGGDPPPSFVPAPAAGMPLVALVLRGVDPTLAAAPDGPLAPLLDAKAAITLISPQNRLPDLAAAARLRAMGVELVAEAGPGADLGLIASLGAVAVLVRTDGAPVSMTALRQFLTEVRDRGMALFNPAPGGGPSARMASNLGLEVVSSLQIVEIRSAANMAALRNVLDGAAREARVSGSATLELWATPATIAEAAAWFAANAEAGLDAASVSMLLKSARPR